MRLSGWALATAAVAMTAGACSSSSGTSPTAAIQAAVNTTIATGAVQENVTSQTPTASGSTTSSATGAYGFNAHEGSFTVDTGALIGKIDVLVNGSTLYIHLPAAVSLSLAGGKAWATVDLGKPPAVPGVGNLASLAGAADPTRIFEGLQAGLVSATKVGATTTDGVAVTQYTAKVDLAKANSTLAASAAALLGGTAATDDVFVDHSGRIAKLVGHVTLKGGAIETVSVTFTGYGSAPKPTFPAASSVVDAAKLIGQ